jgi:hypothetical protein
MFEGTSHVCDAGMSVQYYDWKGIEWEDDGEGSEEFRRVG